MAETASPAPTARTLAELKESGWQSRPIKEELRANLRRKIQANETAFPGILGYEDSVLPQIESALLARHNILLLGLRGQAKTRIARAMVNLLDEWMPIVAGSALQDDPFQPISYYGRTLLAEKGDDTPIEWVHRSARYAEKLATPDVTVADLIGDIDPIKAAAEKLSYSDERVLHFGIIPRANRGIFVINELPDLQARIQVALFNILQEGDIQIRGFKLRLQPDIQFVFTANPEDYTNRGSIVTPLKDRIESQILTHYPRSLEVALKITQQEARIPEAQRDRIHVPELMKNLVEQVAVEARESEFVDPKSGVSARLSISAYEQLLSATERRLLYSGEDQGTARVADLYSIIPAITGKVELVYEGEQEGAQNVAHSMISKAIRSQFELLFPNPEKKKRQKDKENPYQKILDWFNGDKEVDILRDTDQKTYEKQLNNVKGLKKFVERYVTDLPKAEQPVMMEFVLHGLAEFSQLSKHQLETGISFKDLMGGLFGKIRLEDDDYDLDDDD